MTVSFRLSCLRYGAALAVVTSLSFTTPAMAQSAVVAPDTTPALGGGVETPGCNPVNQELANRTAQALGAFDSAVRDSRVPQSGSVLQMTCYNQAAGTSATAAGNLFSGDIMGELQPIVGSALNDIYSDFQGALSSLFGSQGGAAIGGAIGSALGGALGGAFGSGASTLQSEYNCDGLSQTYEAMQNRGVSAGLRAPSFNEMIQGAAPASADEKFTKSWNASKKNKVFDNLKAAANAAPKAQIPSFKNTQGLCDALKATGGNPGNCKDAQ